MRSSSWLELRVPPVVVAGLAAAFIWAAAEWGPLVLGSRLGQSAVAAGLAALGVGVAFSGVLAFARARTTVHPMQPGKASALVRGGIYRFTRNPMYLGIALGLLGWAIHLGTLFGVLGIPGFVAYLTRFQIVPEERALANLFGKEFDEYRSRVRRWI